MGQARRRAADRVGRPRMRSPGRPSVARLTCRQRFWRAIARGVSERGGGRRGWRSAAVGVPWFREGGAMLAEGGVNLRCLTRHQSADTKWTHQKRHARRLATHASGLQSRDLQEKVLARDRDGKEGVDGSSPSEGFAFSPA
jgi:hypothetical protein